MRRGTAILVVLVIAGLAAAGVFLVMHGRASVTAATPPPAPPAVPVVAGTVSSGDVPIYLRGIGTVIAYNTDVVRSQIQGQLTKITFTEGQTVKSGDTLAEIDPRPYQAQLDQMTATRDRDQAQLTNSLADLDRYNQLLAKGDATIQLLDTQKAQVLQLQSAIKSDEALIEAAKVQLEYTKLTSPIAGVTGVRQVDIGNIIHPTDANGLVVVTQIEPISVIFTLPETNLPEIQQQMAKGPLTVLAYSHDDKIKLDEGKLALVNNEILQTTGTIQLKADFPNTAHVLWPGELINARLLLETRHNGISIALGGAAGAERRLCLCRRVRPDGAYARRDRGRDQRGTGADRIQASNPTRPSCSRASTGSSQAAWSRSCTARRPRAPTCKAPSSRQSREPLGPLHPPAGRHGVAHGGPAVVRACRLPADAGLLAAQCQLPDHCRLGAIARRRSGDHGLFSGDAA